MPTNKKTFFGRQKELDAIFQNIEIYRFDKPRHLLYVSKPKAGATTLLKYVHRKLKADPQIVPLYFDFSRLATTPEEFGSAFTETSRRQLQARNFKMTGFTPIRDSRQGILEEALSYPQKAVQGKNLKILYLFDNLGESLLLEHYRGIDNVLRLLSKTTLHEHSSSIMTTSYDKALKRFHDSDSFHAPNLEIEELGQFTTREALEFLKMLLPNHKNSDLEKIALLASGQPFYLKNLAGAFKHKLEIDEEVLERIFSRAITGGSPVGVFLESYYQIILLKARYYGPLKSLMRFLSSHEGLMQIEICRRLKAKQGIMRLYLKELEELGVIYRDKRRYYFSDLVFREWIIHQR
ncbi:hypothetical protein KKC60_00200 [Patescibacteria group bacterium]|nr:hypothetical protein [Patescibacteria group bacterium]